MIRESRQVGLKTIFDLVKQKRVHFTVGLVFTLIPFAFGAILLLVSTLTDSDLPDVDYDYVSKKGKLTNAILTDIETQSNITINNEHPSIISYKYNNEGKEIETQYRSLDPDRINRMNIGDTVKVKYLADSSIIVGLEPFEFPFDMFSKILIPFLIIGLTMLGLLYLRVRGEIDLYRHGEVKEAEVVSIILKNGLPISGIGQGATVHYQYKTAQGQNMLGESFTSDYTILNNKKQGDLIKIFVSRDNELKSCLIPKLAQIRNNWKIE
ncbi:MAG TPA: DUF3592 domain-containing protein [Cyclobacteriaceae bacterium]|jgi:hypothetical protein|nr:DUF3592 domain-containing protein [Cyclobacteriaceae bacterium]